MGRIGTRSNVIMIIQNHIPFNARFSPNRNHGSPPVGFVSQNSDKPWTVVPRIDSQAQRGQGNLGSFGPASLTEERR